MPPLVLDGTNGVSGVDGTASNPAIEGTDSNTGIFYPAADTVAIGTGGTEALRVNSSQNVGIGTQSPAYKLHVSNYMALGTQATSGAGAGISMIPSSTLTNWFVGSNYVNSGAFEIIPSTAGGGSTFTTPAFMLNSAGNAGLGATPSTWTLSGKALDFGAGSIFSNSTGTGQTRVISNAYYNTAWKYKATGGAAMYACDSGNIAHVWSIAASGSADANITFTQAMTLDASGNLGLGTASPLAIGAGYSSMDVRGSTGGGFYFGATGASNYSFCYATTSALDFGITANAALRFYTNNTQRGQFSAAGNFIPGADNTYTCGQSGTRWSAIWAANGTIQTSDARQKNTITDSDLGLEFISSLRPVSYKWNVGQNIVTKDDEGNTVITPRAGVRTHYGLIAQEVKEALGEKDFGGFIHDSETDEMGLRYDQFISPLIKAIQELNAKVEAQAAEIAALKGNA